MSDLFIKPLQGIDPHTSYRIDYLGNLLRNVSSNQNPLVELVLSELPKNKRLDSSYDLLMQKGLKPIQTYIGVGDIYGFKPGGIFIPNKKILHLSNNVKRILDVNLFISEENISYKQPNDICSLSKKQIIPKDILPLGRSAYSNVVLIKVGNGPLYDIAIPAMELVRYYYASSTKYTQMLFSSNIANIENIVTDYAFPDETEENCHYVKLALGLRKSDAWQAARLRFSEYAYKQAQLLWANLVEQETTKKSGKFLLYPNFPFIGNTKLQALVRWIPLDRDSTGEIRYRAIVSHIIECSYPMPYENLSALLSNDARKGIHDSIEDRKNKKSCWSKPKKTGTPKTDDSTVFDPTQNSDSSLVPLEIEFDMNSFTSIKNKGLNSPIKEHTEYRSSAKTKETEVTEGNQTSSESSGKGSGNQEVHQVPKKQAVKSNINMFCMLKPLFEEQNVQCSYITLNQQPGGDERVSYFPLKDFTGNKFSWSNMYDGDLPRSTAIFQLSKNDRNIYLMEIEKRTISESFSTFIFYDNQYMPVTLGTISNLLYSFSRNKHNRKNHFINQSLNLNSKKHTYLPKIKIGEDVDKEDIQKKYIKNSKLYVSNLIKEYFPDNSDTLDPIKTCYSNG